MPCIKWNTTENIKEEIQLSCDELIPPTMCQVCFIALKFSNTTEHFDFCSPYGGLLGHKV